MQVTNRSWIRKLGEDRSSSKLAGKVRTAGDNFMLEAAAALVQMHRSQRSRHDSSNTDDVSRTLGACRRVARIK
jgi:hypothetical protein